MKKKKKKQKGKIVVGSSVHPKNACDVLWKIVRADLTLRETLTNIAQEQNDNKHFGGFVCDYPLPAKHANHPIGRGGGCVQRAGHRTFRPEEESCETLLPHLHWKTIDEILEMRDVAATSPNWDPSFTEEMKIKWTEKEINTLTHKMLYSRGNEEFVLGLCFVYERLNPRQRNIANAFEWGWMGFYKSNAIYVLAPDTSSTKVAPDAKGTPVETTFDECSYCGQQRHYLGKKEHKKKRDQVRENVKWSLDVLLENPKLLQCSACKNAYYCDKKCQKKHWAIHRIKCKYKKLKKKKKKKLNPKEELEHPD